MRVGILALASMESGGTYQYTRSLVSGLLKYGTLDYVVIRNHEFPVPEFQGRHRSIGVEVPHLTVRSAIERALYVQFPRFGRYLPLSSVYDSIRLCGLDVVISPVASLVANSLRRPYVVTVHDLQHKYHPEFFSLMERLVRNYVLKKSAGAAACVVCESSMVKRDIGRFLGIGPDHIRVIQSPPPDTICSFHPRAEYGEALRRRCGLPHDFLFYPARFWSHKNHLRLIECIRLIKVRHHLRIGLVLVGSKERNFEPTMRRIKELGCEDQVRWLGYVAENDLPYLYQLAKALILPSLFESVSLPIWEAFYLGCPVVSSNICALPEQVGDAGLLFDPGDIEDMAEKVIRIWSDRDMRCELVRKGYERIRGFTHESHTKEWERTVLETSGV